MGVIVSVFGRLEARVRVVARMITGASTDLKDDQKEALRVSAEGAGTRNP